MTEPVIVPHPNTIRGPIESEHNGLRDAREKQYVTDRVALEADYHADLVQIQSDKQDAMVAAGLNADGGVPPDYGSSVTDTAVPTITGVAKVGVELTAHAGSWTGTPTFAYKWQKADDANGTNRADIAGETDSTYTPDAPLEGKFVRVVVTASNVGSVDKSANSAYTGAVAAA